MVPSKKKSNKTKKGATSKRTRPTTAASSLKGSKKPRFLPPSPYGPFWNGTTNNAKTIAVLENERDRAFHYDARVSRLHLVQDVWKHEIIPYLNVRELAVLRPTCSGRVLYCVT